VVKNVIVVIPDKNITLTLENVLLKNVTANSLKLLRCEEKD